jgi:hypothetical protein
MQAPTDVYRAEACSELDPGWSFYGTGRFETRVWQFEVCSGT